MYLMVCAIEIHVFRLSWSPAMSKASLEILIVELRKESRGTCFFFIYHY